MSRQIPSSERPAALYAEILSAGFVLSLAGETIEIQPSDRVTEALRKRVAANEAALIAHLRTLPQRKETASKTITETQSKALDIMVPSERFLRWIRLKLKAQEEAEKRKAPQTFHEIIHAWERIRANEPPTEIAILTEEDWQRFIELVF